MLKKLPNGTYLDFDKISAVQPLPNQNLLVVVDQQTIYLRGVEKDYTLEHLSGKTFFELDNRYVQPK